MLAALICAAYATLLLPRPEVDWFTFEDGVWETMGAVGIFAASVTMILLWFRARGRTGRIYQLSLLCFALAFFVVGGEEIAWGQHVFHWPTPGPINRHNYQHETTLHNLREIKGGPNLAANIFWFFFGVVIPVAAALNASARSFLRRYLPVFPLWLAGLFLLNYVISKGVRVAIPSSLYHGSHFLGRTAVELKEAWWETLFFFAAVWVYWGEPGEPPLIDRALRAVHRNGGPQLHSGSREPPRKPLGRA